MAVIIDEETRAWAQPWKKAEPPTDPALHAPGCMCVFHSPRDWRWEKGEWIKKT
jgi:hypothetical protein